MASIVGRILSAVAGFGSPDMWTGYHQELDPDKRQELTEAATKFVVETQNVKRQVKMDDELN